MQQLHDFNTVCYEKVIQQVRNGHQVGCLTNSVSFTQHTHTWWFNVHSSQWVSPVTLCPSSYILFNTIPPCPSQTEEGMAVKEEEWRQGHPMRGNFVARCPSCRQSVLKISTGPHPFFNHRPTPEGRDVTHFYVCCQMSFIQLRQKSVCFCVYFIE